MQETPKSYGYSQPEENVFGDLIKKYLPYWPLYLIFMVFSIGATYVYLRYQVPVFQANASLLIKDGNKGNYDQTNMMQQFNAFGSNKVLENEVEVIKTRKLAREVVKNLHLYTTVAQEGRFNDLSAYINSPISIEARHPDSISSNGRIYFAYNYKKNVVVIDGKGYALNQWYHFPYGELRFVPNKNHRGITPFPMPYYFSLTNVKSASYGLLGRLNVQPSSEQSSVLRLSILDQVPKRAEDILNEWIACYNRAAVEDKNILAANTLKFIEERLKFVVEDLDSVEHQVERFKADNRLVDISAQGQMFLQGVNENDKKLAEMSLQLAVLDQVESYVRSKNKQAGIVPATLGVNDPLLMQLLQGLYDAETQSEKLQATKGENFPAVTVLADQIEKMRGNILENVQSQRRNLVIGKNGVSASNNKYSSLLSALPKKERELVDISRQQAIKNNIYTFLLQTREETALSSASTVADTRVLDVGESNGWPILANGQMMYTMAVLGALLLGIGLVTIKDLLNYNILSRSEIEKLTSVPVLGEVVNEKSKKSIVIGEGERTFIAEQFRYLRTYLGYLGINNRKKKVLVTSSIPGEGKSFMVANLGVSLALAGKKVVLLELDLRKPKLSAVLNVSHKEGISNFLIGDKGVEEIIKKTTLNDNLFVVPAGPIPPNPAELLMNGKLQELFSFLEQSFDCIIIDTAPVGPVTDSLILMPMCDATLFVVRQGHTPKAMVRKLEELYQSNGQKNMAVIFNGVKERGFTSYNNGYGKGYGYGYTQEENKKLRSKKKVLS